MKVLDLVAAGRLKPVIFKAFDLGRGAARRTVLMESRNFFGRMLMHPGETLEYRSARDAQPPVLPGQRAAQGRAACRARAPTPSSSISKMRWRMREKVAARRSAREALPTLRNVLALRARQCLRDRAYAGDVEAVVCADLDALLLPKAETAAGHAPARPAHRQGRSEERARSRAASASSRWSRLAPALPRRPRSRQAGRGSSPSSSAPATSAADLGLPTIRGDLSGALAYGRAKIVYDARAAGLPPPLDGPFLRVRDQVAPRTGLHRFPVARPPRPRLHPSRPGAGGQSHLWARSRRGGSSLARSSTLSPKPSGPARRRSPSTAYSSTIPSSTRPNGSLRSPMRSPPAMSKQPAASAR